MVQFFLDDSPWCYDKYVAAMQARKFPESSIMCESSFFGMAEGVMESYKQEPQDAVREQMHGEIYQDAAGESSESDTQSEHYIRCKTPGCSRPRDEAWNTCCSNCARFYSHSNECNIRCGYPQIPPRPLTPRGDLVHWHHANSINVLHIPNQIGTLPTSQEYHFNPSCLEFIRAHGVGNLYRPCMQCIQTRIEGVAAVSVFRLPPEGAQLDLILPRMILGGPGIQMTSVTLSQRSSVLDISEP